MLKAHGAILEAIAAGDADQAEGLMREHLEWMSQAAAESLRGPRD